MESDLWRGFVAVAEAGSFTAASDVLPVSQSGLSQHIRRLESLLGVELFERTTRSVKLTPTGTRLLPLVVDLVAAEDAALALARDERDRDEPDTIRIFVAEDATGAILVRLMNQLRAAVDDVRVEVVQVSIVAQASAFGVLDVPVALIERTPTPAPAGEGRRTALRSEPMCLVVGADYDGPDPITVAEAGKLGVRRMDWLPPAWSEWFPLLGEPGTPEVADADATVMVVSSFRAAMQSVALDGRPCVAPVSIADTMAGADFRTVSLVDAPQASLDLVTVAEHPLLDLLHAIALVVTESDASIAQRKQSVEPS